MFSCPYFGNQEARETFVEETFLKGCWILVLGPPGGLVSNIFWIFLEVPSFGLCGGGEIQYGGKWLVQISAIDD